MVARRNLFAVVVLLSHAAADAEPSEKKMVMKRLPNVQFIAALGDPGASSGKGAESWGIWRVDPGPRGVRLHQYKALEARGGVAPAGWTFDTNDWWLEEHGLIMEKPDFPLPPGRYAVTGDREITTVLTIEADGSSWKLDEGTLYDVTHLPCRSARYTPAAADATPNNANPSDFPVKPGSDMPAVKGCNKQDYAVVFVVGIES